MTTDTKLITLALDLFLTAKQAAGISTRTLEAYRHACTRFADWLTAQGVAAPDSITADTVRRYIVHLQTKPYTSATRHDFMRPVKTWLRFLHAEGVMAADVMARVAMPKQDKPILPAFTREHIKALLDACERSADPERDTALLLVLLDTGLRASELCALTLGDFDTATGTLAVRKGKGGKGRTVYVGARTRKAIVRYLLTRTADPASTPLFPSHAGGPLNRNSLLLFCRRLGARADVPNCHPHTFRRTMALESLRAGMDVVRLAALLGHSDLQTVRKYLALVEADLAAAHREHGAVDALLSGKKGR